MIRVSVESIQLTTVIEERPGSFGEVEEAEHRYVSIAGILGPAGKEEPFTIELPRGDIEDLLDAVVWGDEFQSNLSALLRDVIRTELSHCLRHLARD